MTSTNDGKDVKSYQTSGPKGKTYFIELYKTLDGRLSGECELRERTLHLCEAWRRVHSLCQHSAPTTHPHLLSWLQRHTARTVLQTEWQSPKSTDEHTKLENAIDAFISETTAAAAGRSGASPAWETQLLLRGEWFKKTLHNPWGHPVLRALLDTRGQRPGDDEILEWLKEERGVMFVTRLRQLAASKCDDLAMALVTAVMDRVRADTDPLPDNEQAEDSKAKPTAPCMEATFATVLRTEAGFTLDVWELLTDIEFVLLHKGDRVTKCIELAKQTPLRNGYQLVERLQSRLETSPREKKLWKNAKDVSILVAQVVIARCMVIPVCAGVARTALYCCTRSLARLLAGGRRPAAAAALAAPAATARHLHTLAAAVDAQCSAELKPFVCELYVRAITAGMNELERLKLKTEKAPEARSAEQTLCSWFVQLGNLLAASDRMKRECTLTAFSMHPTPAMYERIKAAHILPPRAVDENVKHEPTSDFGSWATDSRTQTNLVKTSETLNIKQTQQSANIMSTAILTEGEGLGLMPELCQDLAVLLSGPRVKTLSWDMEREMLLENCRTYMERTHGGTRALTTELKYLNLDPSTYQHLPEEEDDENDVYYGIEKGYEHLVELQEQESIWQTPLFDDEQTESACSSSMEIPHVRRKKKTKNYALFSDDESDPLCVFATTKKSEKKKERPHSKERCKDRSSSKDKSKERKKKTKSAADSAENKERSRERRKDDNKEKKDTTEDKEKKKEKKPRKKKPKKPKEEPLMDPKPGSLSSLIGMKVAKIKLPTPKLKRNPESKETPCVTDSDYDSQGKSSLASLNSTGNDPDVLFDGLFSMDDYRSPEKYDPLADRQPFSSSEVSFTNGQVAVNTATKPAVPFGIKIHNKSLYQATQATQRQNVVNNSNNVSSSDLNATKKVNTVRDEVKKSISKLLEYRRQKTLLEDSQRLASPTPLQNPSPSIYKSPNAIIRQEFPEETVISPKAVDVPEIPKLYINKKQVDQIKDLKNEVDLFLKAKFAPKSVQAGQIKDIKNELDEFIKSKFSPKPVIQFAGKQNTDSTPQAKSTVINELQNLTTSQSATSIGNRTQQDYCAASHTNKQPDSMNQNLPASKISDASMQRNFHDFLRELQESINAGTGGGAKKTAKSTPNPKIKKEIKPTSKVSPIIPAVTSKNKPSSSPSAKSYKQGKKVETQLNTFSRLSYMHKNKQQNITPLDLVNQIKEEHKLVKHKYQQSIGAVTISRKNITQSATTSDNKQNVIRKVERQTATSASYPVLSDILHTKQGAIPKRMNSQENLAKKQQPQSEKCGVKIWSHPKESSLSENDQNDLLLLLRQQSKLNVHPTPVNNTDNVCKVNKTVNNLQCSKISTANNTKCNPEVPVGPPNLIKKYPMEASTNISYNNKKVDECNVNMATDISHNMMYTKMVDCKTSKVSKTATTKKVNTTPNRATVTSITPHQHVLNTAYGENTAHKKYGATSEDTSRQDWEKVMDAILSHKTPSRGPNALDMVLKKKKTLRSQRIVKPNHINNTQVSNVANQAQTTMVSSMPNTSLIPPAPIVSTTSTVQLPHTNMKLDRSQKPNELANYLKKQQSQIIQQEVDKLITRYNQLEPTTKVINESCQLESAQESQACKQTNKLPKNQVFHQKDVQISCTHNTLINKKHPVHQEIVKKVPQLEQNTEINAKVQKKPIITELLQAKDPFISGIPNSDYDLLEELMDDELRKEIGELSSDEDTYRAPTCTVKGNKLSSFDIGNNVIKNTEIQQDKVYPISATNMRQNCRETIIHTNNQTSVRKCQNMLKNLNEIKAETSASNIIKVSNLIQYAKDCKVTPKFVEKSSVACTNVIHQPVNTNVMKPNKNNEQHPSMITNSQINVVGARNVIITALPQAALQNVVLIGSELVYDPFATTQTQVNSGISNANQAPYVTFNNNTNNNPNIAVYQSTQFTAPVVNPVIIGNAMAVPLPPSEILDSSSGTGINNMDASNYKAVPLSSTSSEMLESPLDIEINRINSSNQTPVPLPATPSEILNIPLDSDLKKKNSNNQNIKDHYLTSLHEAIRMHEVKSNENISFLEIKSKVITDNILQDEITEEFIKHELNLLDINSNKNCERKVLKEVQEKQSKLFDQINSIKIKTKSPEKKESPNELENIKNKTELKVLEEPDHSLDNMGDVENLMDIERIKNKRLAIINREISNRSNNPPIPLSYAPLVRKAVANKTPHNEDNNDNSKRIKSNKTHSRRILLRSCNSLKSNAVASDSESSKNAVVRKMKVRLKDEIQEKSVEEAINLNIKADSSGKDNTVLKKPKRERKQQIKHKKGQKVNSTGTLCSKKKSKIPKSTLKVDNKTEDTGAYVNGEAFNFIDIKKLETNEPKILESPQVDEKDEHKKATSNDEHECLPRNCVYITNNLQRDLLESEGPSKQGFNNIKHKEKVSEELPTKGYQQKTNVKVVVPVLKPVEECLLMNRKSSKTLKRDIDIQAKLVNLYSSTGLIAKSLKSVDNKQMPNDKSGSTINSDVVKFQSKTIQKGDTPNCIATSLIQQGYKAMELKDNTKNKDIIKNLPVCNIPDKNEQGVQPLNRKSVACQGIEQSSISSPTTKCEEIQIFSTDVSTDVTQPKDSKSKQKSGIKDKNALVDAKGIEYLKNNITIEEMPSTTGDPNNKCVRIKLANGKVFKATVFGKMHVSFESLFSNPAMKNTLLTDLSQSSQRYTLNIKQVSLMNKQDPSKIIDTRIEEIKLNSNADIVETVNLLSDDEDEAVSNIQYVVTEFGNYKVSPVDEQDFERHKIKLKQKCFVKLNKALVVQQKIKVQIKTNISNKENNKLKNTEQIFIDTKDQSQSEAGLDKTTSDIMTPVKKTPEITTTAMKTTDITTTVIKTPEITTTGITTPYITTTGVKTPKITTTGITTPDILITGLKTTRITSTDIITPDITTTGITIPDTTITGIKTTDITTTGITSTDIITQDITTIEIKKPDITTTEIKETDITTTGIRTPVIITPDITTTAIVATPDIVTPVIAAADITTPDKAIPDNITQDKSTPDNITSDKITPEIIAPDNTTSAETKIEIPIVYVNSLLSSTKAQSSAVSEVIEIDDSSNDSEKILISYPIPPIVQNSGKITSCSKPKEMINELKHLLLKDLGVEDTEIDIERPENHQHSVSNGSNTSETCPKIKNCFVELTRCDYLVKQYEQNRIIKQKCTVDLIRCDDIIETSTEICNENLLEIGSDEFIDVEGIECESPSQLSRSGSFSILNDFSFYTEKTSENYESANASNDYDRSSPVIDIFETIAAFKNYSIGNKGKSFPEQNQSHCYSEWYKTKYEHHLESCVTNNDRHALSDNIVDNLSLSNKNRVNDSLPSLKTLTANIFQDYSTLDRYTKCSQPLPSCLINTEVKQTSLHSLKRKIKCDEHKSCENKIFKTLANRNLDRHTKVSSCQQDSNVTSSENKIISNEEIANDESSVDTCTHSATDEIIQDYISSEADIIKTVPLEVELKSHETILTHISSDAETIKTEPLEVELKSHETVLTHISSDAAIITTASLEVAFNSHEELQDSVKNAVVESSTDSKVSDNDRTVQSIDLQNHNVYSKSHKENINEHLSNVTIDENVMLDKIKEIVATNSDINVSKTEVHSPPNEKKTVLQINSEENKESEVVEAASEQSIDEYEHEVNIKPHNSDNICVSDEWPQQNYATTHQSLETPPTTTTKEITTNTNNDIIDVKKSNGNTLDMPKPAIINSNVGKSSDEHLNDIGTDNTGLSSESLTSTANTKISDNGYKDELSDSRYELINIKNNCQSPMVPLGSYDYKIEVTEDETLSDGDSVHQNNFESEIEKISLTLNKCNDEESMKNDISETILTGGCEINNTQQFITSSDANVFQDNKIVDERIHSDDKVDTESNNSEIRTVKILTDPELEERHVAVYANEESVIYNSDIVKNTNTQHLNNSQDSNLPKGNKDPILKLKEEVIYYDENVIDMQINDCETETKEIAKMTLEKTEVLEGNDCVESEPEEIFENAAHLSESFVAVNILDHRYALRGKTSSELKCLDVNKDSKVKHNEPVNLLSSLITDVKGSGEPIDFEASVEDTNVESLEQSLENPARKEVTLIYKDGTDLVLNGIEYEDPVVGTCYVFPLANDSHLYNENDDSEEVTEKIYEDVTLNKNFDDEYILELKKPTITYSKRSNIPKSKLKKIKLNILKRKTDMSDVKYIGKRYRKGQFDYPRLLMPNLSHYKEYKKVFDYCSSLKFSFSQPFHKDNIDVEGMVRNWPIKGSYCNNLQDESENESILFRDDEKGQATKNLTNVSFAEEINADYIEGDLLSDNIDEANFNMGFGEGSDRVIQNLKDVGDVSKFSAATLSDVKQPQPFLLSEDSDDCEKKLCDQENTKQDQLLKMKRYMTYINLRDKVRSFFKKTTVELCSDWIRQKNDKSKPSKSDMTNFPFDLYQTDFIEPLPIEAVVQVVQVGQLPVSAAAQNPVTCDPRVTQVSDASPSQCSIDNSPQDDSEVTIKTEYTELTTADFTMPLHEHIQHNQNLLMESQNTSYSICNENIPIETEIKSVVKIELEELPEVKEENREIVENNEFLPVENNEFLPVENNEFLPVENNEFVPVENNEFVPVENNEFVPVENNEFLPVENKQLDNQAEYMCETNNAINTETLESETDYQNMFNSTEKQNINESYEQQQKQQNGTPEKTDQIAHAMNAAGITTTAETMTTTTRAHALVNMLSQKLRQGAISATQTATNNYSKTTAINAMALQQALAQILPPPLNQTTSNENNQQSSNAQMPPQVLHIVQGKNATGSQITLVDNSQQSVINNPNATPVLHIVQNKSGTTGVNSNGTANSQTNSFSGLSLVDAGLQQGGNQLLHIVNTGNQKNNNATGQLLKRVNLLTNLTNVQGSNEQKMVQFVCKSADGKSIQLNAPHQRSMVLRLQPIESPNCNVQAKPAENQDTSPNANSLSGKDSQEIKSRSVYEENYAKFIQNSSNNKSTLSEKSTSLPKFNQAFGKPVFQEGNQKQNDINSNNSHLQTVNNNSDANECQPNDNAINLDHIGQINSPPLLLRKSPQTSQAQANLVQQLKQTMAPMNIQTMHGGVIYTRQIPVNIGGGQTINLITVPSTELIDDSASKQSGNQNELEQSIIKIVPQNQNNSNNDIASEDGNGIISGSNETTQNSQPQQPVLTQMRIKLPMLSKAPQMVSGARVVRPSFFQIQRNVIGGANQPVYQQLVLTAAPPLGQQTIRLPQTQTSRPMKVASENQSTAESQMSSSTLEQLREFDMVLEQVKERSTVQPSSSTSTTFPKHHTPSTDTTDGGNSASSTSTETTQQVLYSIGNNQPLNVAYVNRKATVTTPVTSTYVRSPDSSGIVDTPTTTHVQIRHTVTSEATQNEAPPQPKPAKVTSKPKSRPKASSNPPNTLKLNTVPPKTSTQKPLEDEQTTQRILYILAEYKEQVENSPDKDKPAPRRRTNPPSNPGSSKRKKSSSSRRHGVRDLSPIHGDDTCRTMGSEDSSCGTSQGDCNESCLESHSPQDSPRKVVRKLTFEHETPTPQPRPQQPQRNVIVADGQTITVARGTAGKPTTAVLMPANYILPVSMVKGGQQIAIVTNRGPKLLTVGGEGGTTNALLLQRLIGPAGLKPVLTRPGVRHVRLPTAALHNLQAFNLATATTIRPPDSTASPAPAPNPPELVDTRATSSPWTKRDNQETKPERASSPEGSEPWHLPSSGDPHDYSYEETVRTDNLDRTVLVVQKKDGHRQHRLTHVSAAALRHKYAILEHELRLQKSLSEECEDLGVDSPSASELFPEAELLFAASPAHDHNQDQGHQSHTPQPTMVTHSSIPQPDMDDQIATDQLLSRNDMAEQQDLNLGLEDVGIVTVSEDGMQATIALDQEEFARSHPNTTFHSEPTDEGVVQPFTIAGLKGRHITSAIFHSGRAPATVLMTAPQTTVISQAAAADTSQVKYGIDNMIHIPAGQNNINLASVLVKDDGLTRFDSILNDSRELHLSNTASAIVHSAGNATQVIRRVCYDDDKNTRFLMDEPDALIAGDDAKMVAEDSSRDAIESMTGDMDNDRLSPERHAELFWESNSASERSESRRPMDFSSDSEKCCKSPSYDETNSTDSSGVGTHMRLDSVIKEARGIERSASADCSSADDTHPPLRTYPPKRLYHPLEGDVERSLSGKTRAGERSPDSLEVRRRASGRGVVKRGCHCCNGSPAPPRPKKSRQRKPTTEFTTN